MDEFDCGYEPYADDLEAWEQDQVFQDGYAEYLDRIEEEHAALKIEERGD
jgi:hypothetical protein